MLGARPHRLMIPPPEWQEQELRFAGPLKLFEIAAAQFFITLFPIGAWDGSRKPSVPVSGTRERDDQVRGDGHLVGIIQAPDCSSVGDQCRKF